MNTYLKKLVDVLTIGYTFSYCYGSCGVSGADTKTPHSKNGRDIYGDESVTNKNNLRANFRNLEGFVPEDCPDRFFLNPTHEDVDHKTFLRQFKPCGFYKTHCADKFTSWFGSDFTLTDEVKINTNVCYPGQGDDDLYAGVHLVEFDIGLDEATYDAYLTLKNEDGGDRLIDDIDATTYLDFDETGSYKSERAFQLGETCIETFSRGDGEDSHWGDLHGNNFDCMGTCGPGCMGAGHGKDCLKHDICSYYKGYVLEEKSEGFCMDFDCGDEAAQTVSNCWINTDWYAPDKPVICNQELDDTNPNFYVELNPAARLQKQKMACTLRSGWDRNQGMPWHRYPDGTTCTSGDDCQSRRCDAVSWLGYPVECQPRLNTGEGCNENDDCINLVCRSRKCLQKHVYFAGSTVCVLI